MAGEERERRHLHERLEQTLGGRAADHLLEGMAMLEGDQRTTAQAVDLLRADMELGFANLRHEMAELRGDLHGEMAELRGDLRAEMAGLRGEVHGEMVQLRADMFELLHEQAQRAESQFRTLLFAMLGTVLTVAAMAFGAASI